MNLYAAFLKKQIRNYLFGSAVAVLAVGSLILFSSLEITAPEYLRLMFGMSISFVIMAVVEIAVFMIHIRLIRIALKERKPELAVLEKAYYHTHQLPKKAYTEFLALTCSD